MHPAITNEMQGGAQPAAAVPAWPMWLPTACEGAAALLAILALALAALATLTPPLADAEAGLACAGAALALVRLAAAARRRHLASLGWIDASTGLLNRRGLAGLGESRLEHARRAHRPAALLVLDFRDLPEVREIYGRELSRKLVQRVVRKLQALAGNDGLAARTDRTEFAVLLPGLDREGAERALRKALGTPCRIELETSDSEIVLVPSIVAATATHGESVDQVYGAQAASLAQLVAHEQRRQAHMRRERERHSRPMSRI